MLLKTKITAILNPLIHLLETGRTYWRSITLCCHVLAVPQASAVSHFWRLKALSDPLQPIFCSYLPWNNTVLSLIAQCLSAPSAVPGCCKLGDPAGRLGATDSKISLPPVTAFIIIPCVSHGRNSMVWLPPKAICML